MPSEIWIPPKCPYIAVRPHGERVVKTYVNRAYVDRWVAPRRYERTNIVGGIADGPYERFPIALTRLVAPRETNRPRRADAS